MTELECKQLDFFGKIRKCLEEDTGKYKNLKQYAPKPWNPSLGKNYYNIPIRDDNKGWLVLRLNSKTRHISIEFYIGDDSEFFKCLESKKAEIEAKLGCKCICWQPKEGRKHSTISVKKDCDFTEKTTEDEAIEWLLEKADKFSVVFGRRS